MTFKENNCPSCDAQGKRLVAVPEGKGKDKRAGTVCTVCGWWNPDKRMHVFPQSKCEAGNCIASLGHYEHLEGTPRMRLICHSCSQKRKKLGVCETDVLVRRLSYCQMGCGTLVAWRDFQEGVEPRAPITEEGHLNDFGVCNKCIPRANAIALNKALLSKTVTESLQPHDNTPAQLSPVILQRLETFKQKLGPKKAITSSSLGELIDIILQK